MAGGTISDWIVSLRNAGFEEFAESFHTEKSGDDKRLIESGLPIFDRFQVPYPQFTEDNKEVMGFLLKYEQFVVRALPIEGRCDLSRRPKIGVYTFDECREFLDELFLEDKFRGNEEFYNVSLVEREPAKESGIIISREGDMLIDIGECGLDKLSHGENPSASCSVDFSRIGYITNKMHWTVGGNLEDEKLVQRVLRYIELSRDSFNPHFMKGYFEFLVTDSDRIVFWDFKVNEMYLK